MRDVNGLVGEGVLRALVLLNLQHLDRSTFAVNLVGAEASRILAPFSDLADLVDGPMEVDLRGTLGREWRATGSVALMRGRIAGLEVTDWRMPIGLYYSLGQERGELVIRDSAAQVAHGRATAAARLTWGTCTRIEGGVRFFDADFSGLAARAGSLRSYAVGKVTGHFDFGSNDFRTRDDLNGTLVARLAQSQALEVPVLTSLVPFIAPGQSALTFQSGDVRAILAGGTFRLQRLALMSPALKLVVEGSVGLNGRLDLQATAQSGNNGLNVAALRLLAARVPTIGPIPVGLVAEASTLLAFRVVHMRISGTVRAPVTRIDPVALLTDESIRILVLQYVLPIPGATPLP